MNRTHRATDQGAWCAVGLVALALGLGAVPTLAQSPPGPSAEFDPELIIELNEGIRQYQTGGMGLREVGPYQQAITHFDAVLNTQKDNQTALLFRCLSHGQIGLATRRSRDDRRRQIDDNVDLLKLIERENAMDLLNDQIAEAEAKAQSAAAASAERNLHERNVELLTSLRDRAQQLTDQDAAALPNEINRLRAEVEEIAAQEADSYTRMRADLQQLISLLQSPTAVVRLLDVLAAAKIARINEERAAEQLEGAADLGISNANVAALRQTSDENLQYAASVLQRLLVEELEDETLVRAKFFLGVIRFRQAVPRRAEGENPAIDPTGLQEAESLMSELVADERADDRWRSYAWLYRGMIASVRAAQEPDPAQRTELFASARSYLNQAAELDFVTEGDRTVSRSRDVIPQLVLRQKKQIDEYEAQPVTVSRHQNNLQLSVGIGALYDTNVVLLGERTDLPRGISKKNDFGFTLNTALDYTLDLGRVNERLKRWTIGLQGRVGQLWHVEVDEFDEQNYGASAAIQYELFEQKEGFGPVLLRLQYDYDLTLLGRSRFLESHSITPNIQVYSFDRRSSTELYFRFADRTYSEPLYDRRFARSGDYYELGLAQSVKLVDMTGVYERWQIEPWGLPGDESFAQDDPDYPSRYLTPYFGAHYSWDQTDGEEFDLKEVGFLAGVRFPLPYGLELDAHGAFDWQNFRHRGSLVDYHRNGREDFVQRYGVGISRTFALRNGELANRYELEMDRVLMTIRAYANWTLDDSNVVDRFGQGVFEYDRAIYGLSVIFAFN